MKLPGRVGNMMRVDPDNRLVAGELERRWNEKLVQLRDLGDPSAGGSLNQSKHLRSPPKTVQG